MHESIDQEGSSAFAVLWNMMRTILPKEIIGDFESFLEKIDPKFRMDGNSTMPTTGTGLGTYTIKLGPGDSKRAFDFHDAQLAPPAGVMAQNYCR